MDTFDIGEVKARRRGKKWHAHFNTPEGYIRISLRTPYKKAAERIAGEIDRFLMNANHEELGMYLDELAGHGRKGHPRNFAEFAPEFLEKHAKVRNRTSSWKRHEVSLRVHLIPAFGRLPLTKINPRIIDDYIEERLRGGAKEGTVNRELACLKKAMKKAKEWGYLNHDPAAEVKLLEEHPDIPEPLTRPELARFLQACENSSSPDLLDLVVCAVGTGLRRGELFKLAWDQVDLEEEWLHIPIPHAKNKQTRDIPLSQSVKIVLAARHLVSTDRLVFPGKAGELTNITKSLASAAKEAGISRIHLHRLRHTFATDLREGGVELGDIKELMGHKTWVMVERYAKIRPQRLKSAMKKLDDSRGLTNNGKDSR